MIAGKTVRCIEAERNPRSGFHRTGFRCDPLQPVCPPNCGDGSKRRAIAGTAWGKTLIDAVCPPEHEYVPLYSVRSGWYLWIDDLPVGWVQASNDESPFGTVPFQIHTDALGTPRAIVEPGTQTTVWRWPLEGSAFGEHEAEVDPDGDGIETRFPLRYPGQYFDSETGLHYNYQRDYEPGIGRYIESDPIGLSGGVNSYLYVEANPTGYVDSVGLKTRRAAVGGSTLGKCTVVCDRNGGMVPKLDCVKPAHDRCGVGICAALHEQRHIDDIVDLGYGRICSYGYSAGKGVGFKRAYDNDNSERGAYAVSLACIIKLQQFYDPKCDECWGILEKIKEVQYEWFEYYSR